MTLTWDIVKLVVFIVAFIVVLLTLVGIIIGPFCVVGILWHRSRKVTH